MSYDFLQSRWYTPGPRRGPINKIVLHTMEAPCELGWALRCAQIAAVLPETKKVSAHYYADPGTVVQGVHDSDIAYAAPGANNDGIQIEQAGYAHFTDGDWSSPLPHAMVQVVAFLVADLSVRFAIPLHFLTAAEMVADPNAKGVTTHAEVNKAFHRSDHTDPGPHYPLDLLLIEARAALAPYQPPVEDEVPYLMIGLQAQQPQAFANIFACFETGAIRQMPLSEYLFLRDVAKVPEVQEATPDGLARLCKLAGIDHSELVNYP